MQGLDRTDEVHGEIGTERQRRYEVGGVQRFLGAVESDDDLLQALRMPLDDQHGGFDVPGHRDRYASEEESSQRAEPAGADDRQVRAPFPGFPDDLGSGLSLEYPGLGRQISWK